MQAYTQRHEKSPVEKSHNSSEFLKSRRKKGESARARRVKSLITERSQRVKAKLRISALSAPYKIKRLSHLPGRLLLLHIPKDRFRTSPFSHFPSLRTRSETLKPAAAAAAGPAKTKNMSCR